jgi:hypothetical protein
MSSSATCGLGDIALGSSDAACRYFDKKFKHTLAPADPIFAGKRGGNNARGCAVKLSGCRRLFATSCVAHNQRLWLFSDELLY